MPAVGKKETALAVKPDKMSEEALADLYTQCMHLLNENKVSAKNAFDLTLIDHLDDLTVRRGDDAEVNFHKAAGTLDASARIYACRVDCVHLDAHKVRGGIFRATEDEPEAEVKRKELSSARTLETERNITNGELDVGEQVDPFFQHIAQMREGGGEKALLMNLLPSTQRGGIVFDGSDPLHQAPLVVDSAEEPQGCPKLVGRICPGLDKFGQDICLPAIEAPDFFAVPEEEQEEEVAQVPALMPPPEPCDEPEEPEDHFADAPLDDLLDGVYANPSGQQGGKADFLFFDQDLWLPAVARRRKAREQKDKENKENVEVREKKLCLDLKGDVPASRFELEGPEKHLGRLQLGLHHLHRAVGMDPIWQPSSDAFFRKHLVDGLIGERGGPVGAPEEGENDFGGDNDFGGFDEPNDGEMPEMPEEPDSNMIGQTNEHGIAYARTSGYVNVKAVKDAMHSSLATCGVAGPEAELGSPAKKRARRDAPVATDGSVGFMDLLKNVRRALPANERGGLSVAIGFICALHLCNDHDLELQGDHGDEVFDTLNARLGDFRVLGADAAAATRAAEDAAAAAAEADEA